MPSNGRSLEEEEEEEEEDNEGMENALKLTFLKNSPINTLLCTDEWEV
jgi:hypothetical protein